MRPLIGIPTATMNRHASRHPLGHYCYETYPLAVAAAGGAPVLVPLVDDDDTLHSIHNHLDGLLLTGGADVDPAIYGEAPRHDIGPSDAAKDRVEMRMIRLALDYDLPLLAICRGQQILNVTMGGTLFQDICSQVPASLNHNLSDRPRDLIAHEISVDPSSRLASILRSHTIGVNSLHHQAVKDVAPGLVVTARAADGVIEGLESPAHRFVVAVQFHPEELYQSDQRMRELFVALVQAAAGRTRG